MRKYYRGTLRAVVAVGMVLALSGCVLVPAYYPRYAYHPHRYFYYP